MAFIRQISLNLNSKLQFGENKIKNKPKNTEVFLFHSITFEYQ